MFYIIEIILHIQQFYFLFPDLNTVLWALSPHHCKFPSHSKLCHLVSTYGLPYFTAAHILFVLYCISQRTFMEKDRRDGPQLAAEELRLPVQLIAPGCRGNRIKVRTQVIPLPFQTLLPPHRRHSTLWNATLHPPAPPVWQTQTTTFNHSRVWKHPSSWREVEISSQNEGRRQFSWQHDCNQSQVLSSQNKRALTWGLEWKQ